MVVGSTTMISQQFELIASPTEITLHFEEEMAENDTSDKMEPTTDSMVTIRLSDAPSVAGVKSSNENSPINEPFPHIQNDLEIPLRDNQGQPDEEVLVDDYEETPEPTCKSATSTSITQQTEQASQGHRSISIITRRDTRGSSSSGESAHVDWEELDKNEEQEQRDEGSDDVSIGKTV